MTRVPCPPVEVPARIEVVGGDRVELTWPDGHVQELSARALRAACPCATCRDPAGAERTALTLAGPVPVSITGAKLVGDYAINFVFAPDGHHTGIFAFDHVRSLESG